MPERIEHAFIGENAVGGRQILAQFGNRIGHAWFPLVLGRDFRGIVIIRESG
jgi:hypothetical protein